ncbi:MAG: folate family ECF transporter S component [Clostridia bacterium]|nr:folate family ECF transporter S component [Clostridia bacterium]
MRSGTIQRKYFKTPFSSEYWRQACSELKDTRVLVFAALMLALRVVMKPLRIPVAADVNITFGFIVNALGAAVYGPVVAGFSAAVSDVLGYLIAPNGVYYVPFILTEIAGSVIFALFLYSTDITPIRLILAKFCVNLFVNILMTEPIMVQYYKLYMTSVYQPFMWIRIVKNLVMLPIESVILMIVFRAAIPALSKAGFKLAGKATLEYTKKHIALLVVLFVVGAGAVAGYAIYDYNNKSFSASYTAQERLEKNLKMNGWVTEAVPELKAEDTVTIIESARSRVGSEIMTYELAIYRINRERFGEKQAEAEADIAAGKEGAKPYTEDTLNGYSKSKAAKDDALVRIGSGIAAENKKTGAKIDISVELTPGEGQ